jgi:hypothetical protein
MSKIILADLSDAHFALIKAAEHIKRKEGWSPAYLTVACAADKARMTLLAHKTIRSTNL